jgi:hypothetical protein
VAAIESPRAAVAIPQVVSKLTLKDTQPLGKIGDVLLGQLPVAKELVGKRASHDGHKT